VTAADPAGNESPEPARLRWESHIEGPFMEIDCVEDSCEQPVCE